MKTLIVIGLLLIIGGIISCIWCAGIGQVVPAIISAEAVVFGLVLVRRELDALREDRVWQDAKRHPRL